MREGEKERRRDQEKERRRGGGKEKGGKEKSGDGFNTVAESEMVVVIASTMK